MRAGLSAAWLLSASARLSATVFRRQPRRWSCRNCRQGGGRRGYFRSNRRKCRARCSGWRCGRRHRRRSPSRFPTFDGGPLLSTNQAYERRSMKNLLRTTTVAIALSFSISVAQTQSTPGGGNRAGPATPAQVPSDPIAPGGHWDVAEGPCRALLDETDDDRAAIGMFYYGYLAAKLNLNVIDTSRIEGDLRHVFETCRDHRAMTIVAAFETLR